jgi:hypothetical protein
MGGLHGRPLLFARCVIQAGVTRTYRFGSRSGDSGPLPLFVQTNSSSVSVVLRTSPSPGTIGDSALVLAPVSRLA